MTRLQRRSSNGQATVKQMEGVMSIDIDNPLVVFKSDGRMYVMDRPKAMMFEEYAATMSWRTVAERTKAKAVWEQAYKQGYKDGQVNGGSDGVLDCN